MIFGKFESSLLSIFTLVYIIIFSLNNTLQGVLRADSKIDRLVKYRGLFALIEAAILIAILQINKQFDYVYVLAMVLAQFAYFFF